MNMLKGVRKDGGRFAVLPNGQFVIHENLVTSDDVRIEEGARKVPLFIGTAAGGWAVDPSEKTFDQWVEEVNTQVERWTV